jgi:hypothetical protein
LDSNIPTTISRGEKYLYLSKLFIKK